MSLKISPLPAGGVPSVNPDEGRSVSGEALARAKAVASGQTPQDAAPHPDKQVERAQSAIKRIKMRTQMSQDRHKRLNDAIAAAAMPVETPAEVTPTAQAVASQAEAPAVGIEAPAAGVSNDFPVNNEQAQAATEETRPLSPQFAALAKAKRALQLEREQFAKEKQAFESQNKDTKSLDEYRAQLKANALRVLQQEGVTYDQLTEQILASQGNDAALDALRTEIQSLKEGLETRDKTQQERDQQVERQVLAQIGRDAAKLVAQGDDYEMIREAGYTPKIVELIHRTYQKTGEVMDTVEAANLIETELLEESLKFAKIKKVQSRLTPAQIQQQAAAKQVAPNTKIMRTLTNRDGSSAISMSKRERAIAAMEGRLSK